MIRTAVLMRRPIERRPSPFDHGQMPGAVILLSGPVGAGKSTVAQHLIRLSPAPLAYLEGDKFWPFIAKAATDQDPRERFRIIMRAMAAAALPFARAGYHTIVDFTFPPAFLTRARAQRDKASDTELHWIVLRPSEDVCAARAAAPSPGAISLERYANEFHEMYKWFDGEKPQHVIQDDHGDAETLAARILDDLHAGKFRVM